MPLPSAFIDSAVCRRLEAAEDIASVQFALKLRELRPELDCAVLEIGGGHGTFAGKGSALSHAIGLGLNGPVSAQEMDRLEDFYFSRRSGFELVIAPLAHETLFRLVQSRPYSFASMETVLARPITPGESFLSKAAHITLNRIGTEQLSQFDDVVARGFVNGGDPAPLQGIFSTFAQIQNSIALMAYYDGHLAAGAGGLIIPQHRMAALFGASTLPEFRDRGLQSALLHARLKLASEAGCDLAVVVTQPGSVSQRNAERAGFRVAYSKALLMRSCPE